MTMAVKKVYEQALALPAADRVALAELIFESLEPEEADADAPAAWAREIARRIAEIDSGAVKMIPWSVARREIFGRTEDAQR